MPIEIPYTFIAGTKAKASEVNANFDAIASFVDGLETGSAEIESDVTTLQSSKADLNGDSTEFFRMKDAVTEYDGVNLRTLKNLTANSKGEIYGFRLAKQSNTSVNATPGSCWDSTFAEMIISSSSLVAEQSNLSANTTYYIYVCEDKETKECQLIISLSNATPTLPTGYEYYRQLGKAITGSNGYISYVETNGVYEDNKSFITLNLSINGNANLSSYIPNDNHIYFGWVHNNMSGKSGDTASIATDIFPSTVFNRLDGDYGRTSSSAVLTMVPIGTGRRISVSKASVLVGVMRA